MRSLRIALVFVLLFIFAGQLCRADDMQLDENFGNLTLVEGGSIRIRCLGGPHPILEIKTNVYDGYLASPKLLYGIERDEYKITLFEDQISLEEAKALFKDALDTVHHFQFDKPGIGVMDGTGAWLQIESNGGNSISVHFDFLADAKEASPGIARIIAIAESHESKDWQWSKKLPAQLVTDAPPRNRKSARIAAVFKAQSPPTIKYLLSALGCPDGFSKQLWFTKSKGSTYTNNVGGTLLFLLDDGTEVHVWTPDFKRVFLAIHYREKENEESDKDVLFSVPIRRR